MVNVYQLVVENVPVGEDESTDPPTPIYLWDVRNLLSGVAFYPPSDNVNPWPAGTTLRSADTAHVYAVNALPSRPFSESRVTARSATLRDAAERIS